jgi:flagellar hook assembly protein FlgD
MTGNNPQRRNRRRGRAAAHCAAFVVAGPLAAGLLAAGLLAGCATVGEIGVGVALPETTYISPKNADGVQDSLVVPAELLPSRGLRVQAYRLTVLGAAGDVVRSKETQVQGGGTGKAARQEVIWDGRNDGGELVADGVYTYTVEAWDRRGNRGSSPPLTVVVDDAPPYVELSCAYRVFSPNGDGRLDTLSISQRNSTEESRWDAQIRSASGSTVRSLSWEGRLPDYEWDGRDEAGSLSPDGLYSYALRSTDLAGNSASFTLEGLTIDTRPSPIALDIDSPSFSPNGDGKRDLLRFYPRLIRREDAASWELAVRSEAPQPLRSYTGRGLPPGMVIFDGKDGRGQRLPDGEYFGLLSVTYKNGDSPTAVSEKFTLDTTPPRAALSAPYLVFSPDGDGRKDTLSIRQSTSVEKLWEASMVDTAGQVVRSASWTGTRLQFDWDGLDEAGRRVPDGAYTYRVTATDEADNVESFELKGIRVDTRPTPLSVSAVAPSFSPNGDGVMDNMHFNVSAVQTDEIESWELQIVHRDGSVKRRFGADSSTPLPSRITWDGRAEGGQVVEGSYQALLSVSYEKGNLSEARTSVFLLDVTPPAVTVRLSPRPFSPDGDGVDDILSIAVEARDESPIEDWSIRVLDPMEHEFTTLAGRGAPRTVTWDGRSRQGELVQSAEDYPLLVTVRDNLWNSTTVREVAPVDVLVLRDGDRLKIIISSIYFKPYTADYTDTTAIDPERVARNLKTLDRLAVILKKYAEYKIRLEGHAVMIYWDQPARARVEQEEVLLPLSRQRAEVIREALIERGVRGDRMSTFGYGGSQPVVPHGDLDNRWKNRRVEFILIKQQG